jgi:hypothetical protein
MEAEVQLLGRRTYEGFAAAWPATEAETGDFGEKMNEMPKYVVSSTLTDPDWENTTVLGGAVVELSLALLRPAASWPASAPVAELPPPLPLAATSRGPGCPPVRPSEAPPPL